MRGSALDALRRSYLSLTRGVIMSVDDSKAVQTVSVRLMQNEMPPEIERFQQYGFHSVPVAPDNNGENGAEALVGFVNGNRSHPVVLADLDRRTRPTNWNAGKPGSGTIPARRSNSPTRAMSTTRGRKSSRSHGLWERRP